MPTDLSRPDPGAIPDTRPEPFGLEANTLTFVNEGVAAATASELGQRFRPIQVLSSGGMGKIVLVQEVRSGRFVALKVMLDTASQSKPLVEQFVREAVITARLQHPHIIPVHDLGFLTSNQLYYTMNYIEGESFSKRMPSLELVERVRILRCAALAVDFAHSKGLWHRDLKPANILVGPFGDTYVIDWGLVTVQPGRQYTLNIPNIVVANVDLVIPDSLLSETVEALTVINPGGPLGTPLYMAPEQWEGSPDRMGAGCDVWAFGIMLFQALTGFHPLLLNTNPPRSHSGIRQRVLSEPLPCPRTVCPDAPEELVALCGRLLQKDPALRPSDLSDFLFTTVQFLRGAGHGSPPEGQPHRHAASPPVDGSSGSIE
jgi:serine/threonine-protein kinase